MFRLPGLGRGNERQASFGLAPRLTIFGRACGWPAWAPSAELSTVFERDICSYGIVSRRSRSGLSWMAALGTFPV
jgi:hypothetical protein